MLTVSTNEVSDIETAPRPAQSTRQVPTARVRALLDIGLASVLLVPAAPIILLCLIAVRFSTKGPVFYSQRRLGSSGRIFTIYKIRTMYQDCELHHGPIWSGPGDPRVTPIGRFLRATHLDELPQLFNVVLGDMSLIGPRPERPEIVAQLERCFPEYRDRLLIRPGLSGLAQVLQGPDTSLHGVHTKLRYDLYYLDNQGFWLDLRIALATLLHLVRTPGPIVARVFGFPFYDQLPVEVIPQEEHIAVSSRIRPDYVNSAAM